MMKETSAGSHTLDFVFLSVEIGFQLFNNLNEDKSALQLVGQFDL